MTKDVLKIIGDLIKPETEYLSTRPFDVFHRGTKDYLVNLLRAIKISATYKGGNVPDSTLQALVGIKLREIKETLELFTDSPYHRGALYGMNKAHQAISDYIGVEEEEKMPLPGREMGPF